MDTANTLEFRSQKQNMGFREPSLPYETLERGWQISESVQPSQDSDFREKGIGPYQLCIRTSVTSIDEVWESLHIACEIADALDVAWCYAWGKPFEALRRTLQSIEAPRGWTGNLRDVERQIQRATSDYRVEAIGFVSRPYSILPMLPLRDAMTAFRAIQAASDDLKQLIRLHISSFKTADGQLFLLAKALEFVGAYWASGAGSERGRRNSGIANQMEAIGIHVELTRSIEWLFDIANTRFDVRHVWNKDSGTLHDSMTGNECADFVFNANLVIHTFVCTQLKITPRMISFLHDDPS